MHVIETDPFAVMRQRTAALEQQTQHFQVFIGHGAAPREGRAQRLELAFQESDTQTEHEPAGGELGGRRRHFCQQDRIAIGSDQHVHAERQSLGQPQAEDRAA